MYLDSNTNVVESPIKIEYMSNNDYNASELGRRIRERRNALGISQATLGMRAGISQGTIGHIESGRNRETTKLPEIAKALECTVDELLGDDAKPTFDRNVVPADLGRRRIPVLSYVQAGRMTEMRTPFSAGDVFEYLLTDLELSDRAFALEIRGQSMEPEFREGDHTIFDPNVQPRPGDFVVAKNGSEEATFKKYRPRGMSATGQEVFELSPLNDDFPTLRSDTQQLTIIAVLVEHRRYLRR